MSSIPLQVQHSKSRIPITFVGLVLIALGLLGFLYAFWPRTTESVIDLGTKFQQLSAPAQAHFSNQPDLENEVLPQFIAASMQQEPPDLVLQPRCETRNVPTSIIEGVTMITIPLTCNRQPIDPSRLKAQWTIDAGIVRPLNATTLVVDTRGLLGKTVTLSGTISGCGRRPCSARFKILVAEPVGTIVVEVQDDSGKGIPDATVTIAGVSRSTGSIGRVRFAELKPGSYSISVVAKGFRTFNKTAELSGKELFFPARLERSEPVPSSPSPTPDSSPSPSPSPTSSISPSASPSQTPSPQPSASAQPSASTSIPSKTSETERPRFAPRQNGTIKVRWPSSIFTIVSGWPPNNVCEVSYEPPAGGLPDGYDVQASFFLTETSGLVTSDLTSHFKPLDRSTNIWTIPIQPTGGDGSVVTAQLMMSVKIRSEAGQDIALEALEGTVVEPPLTRNQTLGGSTISAVLGFGLLGVGRLRKASLSVPASPETPADKRTAAGLEGSDPGSSQTTEPPRYTDVTLYEGHLFRSDDLEDETRVPDDIPLLANNLYTLEVAIRLERTGIQSDMPAEREVENPREAEETLTIHVLATPLAGFKIKERLDTIKWAYNEDSESALFQLEIDPRFERTLPGSIEIRILDQMLNLLDIVKLEVAIAADKGASLDPAIPLRRVTWLEKDSETWTLTTSSIPRLANIHVRPVTGGFTFDFVFNKTDGTTVSVEVFRNISSDDLNNLLTRIRDFWTRLVITNYSRKLTVSAATYDSYLRELRELGIQAWLLLFDSRRADQKGASENVAQLLVALTSEGLKEVQELIDGTDDHTIQISYDADFGDFIFPWSILHPPTPKDATVDPLSFWGARYRIEQVTKRPKKDRIDDRPVNVLFALDPSFGDSPSQKKMFEDYQAAAQGDLTVSGPISDQAALMENLIRNPSVHLLYFYCHGYAATRPGLLTADGVQSLKRQIEEVRKAAKDEDSSTAAALEKLMDLTSKMAGESWIYLGDSEIKETDMRLLEFFSSKRPIVFLNMCQSADLVPSMSSGLVHLFLDHNASAVVGTESPMTSVFADAFARMVLDALFAGDNIGTALWKARRHFLTEQRNPLGLAYTLYGRVDANLCNANKSFVIPVSANSAGPVLNAKS